MSSGLTLQIYGLLLRTRAAELREVPPRILDAIPRRLESLVGQGIESAADAGECNVTFTSHEGRAERRNEAINFLWHPWGIETAALWLESPPPSASRRDRTVVRRVPGHLVVDLEADALRAAGKGYTFVGAETLMGLSVVGGRGTSRRDLGGRGGDRACDDCGPALRGGPVRLASARSPARGVAIDRAMDRAMSRKLPP